MRIAALIRHFWARFFDEDVVQILGLVAVPGIFSSFLMKHYPPTALHPFDTWQATMDRYLFVSYSMVVMGFITVYEWDSLFPDRRDYLILGTLPIHVSHLFFAKVAALCLFLGLFALGANCFSTVLLPAISMGGKGGSAEAYQMMFAHAASAIAGGLFVAFFFAGLQGVLINILTSNAFRWVSPLAQMLSMGLLVLGFMLYPLISALIPTLVEHNSPYLFYSPTFWFLGLYERLRPGEVHPAFRPLGSFALRSLAWVSAGCLLAYIAGYKRHSQRALESIDRNPAGPGWMRTRYEELLHRFILRHPLQRATFHFIGQTLTRSSKHRLFLAAYGGFAIAFAILILFPVESVNGSPEIQLSSAGLLALPLVLSFFLLTALRAGFSFPCELTPNWVFQITDTDGGDEHLTAARKWVAAWGIAPLFACLAPLEFHWNRWEVALFHISFGVILSLLLIEVLFFQFRKIPFACSYCPGKMNAALLAGVYLYGLTTYSFTMADLERWLLQRPLRAVMFYVISLIALGVFTRYRDLQAAGVVLAFEDEPDPVVRTLEIG